MAGIRERITSVITTLQQMEIQSTYDNMDRLLGSIQVLMRVRDEVPDNIAEIMNELARLREAQKAAPAPDPDEARKGRTVMRAMDAGTVDKLEAEDDENA